MILPAIVRYIAPIAAMFAGNDERPNRAFDDLDLMGIVPFMRDAIAGPVDMLLNGQKLLDRRSAAHVLVDAVRAFFVDAL